MTKESGFGLAHIKRQGCAMHPDDFEVGDNSYTDEMYIKQAKAYMRGTGDKKAYFIRQEIITPEIRGVSE